MCDRKLLLLGLLNVPFQGNLARDNGFSAHRCSGYCIKISNEESPRLRHDTCINFHASMK